MLHYEFVALLCWTIGVRNRVGGKHSVTVQLQKLDNYWHHGRSDILFSNQIKTAYSVAYITEISGEERSHFKITGDQFSSLEYHFCGTGTCMLSDSHTKDVPCSPVGPPGQLLSSSPHVPFTRRTLRSPSSCHTSHSSPGSLHSCPGDPTMSFFLLSVRAVASQGSFKKLRHVDF